MTISAKIKDISVITSTGPLAGGGRSKGVAKVTVVVTTDVVSQKEYVLETVPFGDLAEIPDQVKAYLLDLSRAFKDASETILI